MLLEQKFRSISGRVNALEMRITGEGGEAYAGVPQAASNGGAPGDGIEPAADGGGQENIIGDVIRLQGRIAELEKMLEKSSKKQTMVITAGKFSFDVTGLIVGFLLILAGILLATDNRELLTNPLVVIIGGAVILVWVVYKSVVR